MQRLNHEPRRHTHLKGRWGPSRVSYCRVKENTIKQTIKDNPQTLPPRTTPKSTSTQPHPKDSNESWGPYTHKGPPTCPTNSQSLWATLLCGWGSLNVLKDPRPSHHHVWGYISPKEFIWSPYHYAQSRWSKFDVVEQMPNLKPFFNFLPYACAKETLFLRKIKFPIDPNADKFPLIQPSKAIVLREKTTPLMICKTVIKPPPHWGESC